MVTASFKEGQKTAITTSLQKYDYGEVLRIKGLSLPRYVAVQFAVDGMSEALPSSIGETVEDVTDVLIPNSLLRSNIKPWNYNIMAYVYIVSGSSGKTEYTITIPVKWRPKTGDDQAADDDVAAVIGSAVEKMNTATTKAENAANQASATAEEIKADREKITTNEIKIAGLKSDVGNCLGFQNIESDSEFNLIEPYKSMYGLGFNFADGKMGLTNESELACRVYRVSRGKKYIINVFTSERWKMAYIVASFPTSVTIPSYDILQYFEKPDDAPLYKDYEATLTANYDGYLCFNTVNYGENKLTAYCKEEKITPKIIKHLEAKNPHNITKESLGLYNATVESDGLLSKEDKIKLDNIPNGGITISGSGIFKNASAYGFLPSNEANINSDSFQKIVDSGGTILVDMPGTYNICKSIKIPSYTSILFGNNVFIKLVDDNGVFPTYPFINKGAFTEETNTDITIDGLNLITNGAGNSLGDIPRINGHQGFVSFLHAKNITIRNLKITDGTTQWFNVHVQDFENFLIENFEIRGIKDGLHIGAGNGFTIRNGIVETDDDCIALNAHDYAISTSCIGDIKNGVIENIWFTETRGYKPTRGIYMLGGAWCDWSSGMSVRKYGDTVVSSGRIYRTVTDSPSLDTTISTSQPTHESGTMTYPDGITWQFGQVGDIKSAVCKNIICKNLFYERHGTALSLNYDNDQYSRSVHPDADISPFENIMLENIKSSKNVLEHIATTIAPFKNLRIINSDWMLSNIGIEMYALDYKNGSDYPESSVSLIGTAFDLSTQNWIATDKDRGRKLKICISSSLLLTNQTPYIYGNNILIASDDINAEKLPKS